MYTQEDNAHEGIKSRFPLTLSCLVCFAQWPTGECGNTPENDHEVNVVTDHDPPDVIGLDKKMPRCHWLPRKQSPMMSLLHYLMLTFLFEISSGCNAAAVVVFL